MKSTGIVRKVDNLGRIVLPVSQARDVEQEEENCHEDGCPK